MLISLGLSFLLMRNRHDQKTELQVWPLLRDWVEELWWLKNIRRRGVRNRHGGEEKRRQEQRREEKEGERENKNQGTVNRMAKGSIKIVMNTFNGTYIGVLINWWSLWPRVLGKAVSLSMHYLSNGYKQRVKFNKATICSWIVKEKKFRLVVFSIWIWHKFSFKSW